MLDLIIIGAGPAGLTAAIAAARDALTDEIVRLGVEVLTRCRVTGQVKRLARSDAIGARIGDKAVSLNANDAFSLAGLEVRVSSAVVVEHGCLT